MEHFFNSDSFGLILKLSVVLLLVIIYFNILYRRFKRQIKFLNLLYRPNYPEDFVAHWPRQDAAYFAKLLKIIKKIPIDDSDTESHLSNYCRSIPSNCPKLKEAFAAIRGIIRSRKKRKILENYLEQAVYRLSVEELANLYLSGLDHLKISEYREEMDLVIYCAARRPDNKFFELTMKKFDQLIIENAGDQAKKSFLEMEQGILRSKL